MIALLDTLSYTLRYIIPSVYPHITTDPFLNPLRYTYCALPYHPHCNIMHYHPYHFSPLLSPPLILSPSHLFSLLPFSPSHLLPFLAPPSGPPPRGMVNTNAMPPPGAGNAPSSTISYFPSFSISSSLIHTLNISPISYTTLFVPYLLSYTYTPSYRFITRPILGPPGSPPPRARPPPRGPPGAPPRGPPPSGAPPRPTGPGAGAPPPRAPPPPASQPPQLIAPPGAPPPPKFGRLTVCNYHYHPTSNHTYLFSDIYTHTYSPPSLVSTHI